MYRSPAPHHTARASVARVSTVCVCALLLALAIACAAVARQAAPPAVGPDQSPRVCFPAGKWGPAPDAVRPCAQIVRVYEDGSVRVQVTDASGGVRFTTGVGALDR